MLVVGWLDPLHRARDPHMLPPYRVENLGENSLVGLCLCAKLGCVALTDLLDEHLWQ